MSGGQTHKAAKIWLWPKYYHWVLCFLCAASPGGGGRKGDEKLALREKEREEIFLAGLAEGGDESKKERGEERMEEVGV